MTNPINPNHYKSKIGEAIEVIEAFELNFNLGNVLKYVLRAGKKSLNPKEDLEKAAYYLSREINSSPNSPNFNKRDLKND